MNERTTSQLIVVSMWAALCWGVLSVEALTLYVDTAGDDANAGSAAQPFATLTRARDAIRELKAEGPLPAGGVRIEIREGRYLLSEPLSLTAEDSGTAEAAIVYMAAAGAEVRLSGGVEVTGFRPLEDETLLQRLDPGARAHVLVADLKGQGITEYGMPAGGFGYRGPPPKFAELFFNDRPMQIARWPNDGFIKVGELKGGKPRDVRGTKGDAIGRFTVPYDRLERWVDEADLWLHGWWFWDWADQRQKVDAIDLESRVITLADPQHGYGYRKGMWYYAFNALSELDQPGEYCMDRENGLLYFWPPDPAEEGRAVLLQTETLVTMEQTSFVTLQRCILENSRTTAMTVRGGESVRIDSCTFRNLGGWAVSMSGARNSGVVGCDIYETGQGGVSLSGGDRKTLTSIGLHALNNHIHHYSRWNRILKPGLAIHGVGIHVAHNLIHNAPHMAIMFSGNDHLFEYNEIHSVCHESNDAGAIYAGRDWTMRGHVIRHNYLHHISGFEGRGCVGVYLDDMFSGVTISGNVFYDVTRAAFIGGGRDNVVENNLFIDCKPALHIDARALGWAGGSVQPGATMHTRLQAVPYQSDLWRNRYPELVSVWEDEPAKPKGNVVSRNICWGGRWDEVQNAARAETLFDGNILATARQHLDVTFQLGPDHPALAGGFEPIPWEEIGLRNDRTRASWPVLHTVRPRGRRGEKVDVVQADNDRVPAKPLAKAQPVTAAPAIDGEIRPEEWRGADPSRALLIAEGLDNQPQTPRSTAWILRDDSHLYVAVDNAVDPERPLQTEPRWGSSDAVELAFRNATGNAPAPILILRGYPCGEFESSDEAGAPADAVNQAATGVRFATRIVGPGRWTAEWAIPFASLGIDPEHDRRVEFNIAVRKTGGGQWLLWRGTNHATWQVGNAGRLVLAE